MTLNNYDFNGFTISIYFDEQGDWLAYFQEMSNISAFGDTPQQALEELNLAWELLKEDYQAKGKEIPIAPARKKFSSSL
ncbi:type II toxin-antitoxin system HicB family antitoxin [Nostoc sp. TCL26-01]|uniref:type II toxin-antitoxin system HicB family antitoxin n=1 Tax=Nostoc sp. TCL26-01 TaxID=2576904 RepID=UPI0015BC17FD|nr:type II toxin-antitoxin system HicB family antitoxin [Nostoc sp. TCL26-01]QLE57330.1 type II toxin-antitoxin system HicB family antitoxin [Nostoc sp. TCL26-01]